ncbi:ATP-binding cassette domain-containing protein, partial [Pseudoduganella buxea]
APSTDPQAPAQRLSGGELARVALAGAFLSGADTLVLDEPTNHLDAAGRAWLMARLRQWRGAAIVVSHDRGLLALADGIVELAGGALRAYGGNYSLYERMRDAEATAARAVLEHARVERGAGLRALRRQHDARQARTARQ